MPIYEYQCRGCGEVIERIQRVSDKPLRKCESCGGRLDKLISRTSFQLKGGGWFDQGYGGGKTKGKSGSKAKPKSGGSDKKEPKSSSDSSKVAAAG